MSDFSQDERDAVYRAIHTRRDTRTYRPDPVPPETLWRLLEAAHRAPSVGFMQPWNFLLIEDPATRSAMHAHVVGVQRAAAGGYAGDQRGTYEGLKLQGILDAPVNLLITCDRSRGGNVLGRPTLPETDLYSTCLAIQNLWLAARAEGLGLGWVSLYEPGFVRELLGLPESVVPVAWLTMGVPVELPDTPLLERIGWRSRLPLEDLVFRDRWNQPEPRPVPGVLISIPEKNEIPAADRNRRLTKPPGSLGRLEQVALRVAEIQGAPLPRTRRKVALVLAGDHGVTAEGVSAYQRKLTARMVLQFASGTGSVNALARQYGVALQVADLGVDHDFGGATAVLHHKVRRGTRNLAVEDAMTPEETEAAVRAGRALCPDADLLAVGEMGIGNSTVAAALAAVLLGISAGEAVGRGTGVGDRTMQRKREVVAAAMARGPHADPLAALGGYEVAGLVGLMLEAAERRIPVVLDGYLTGVAALLAVRRDPRVADVLIAGHRSAEPGHGPVLEALGLLPVLDLGLRLGEASGAVLAVGLIDGAARVLTECKTFEEAGIDEPLDERGGQ